MESARETWRRLTRLWRRAEQESGLDEEIRFHIEKQIEKNIARGMGPEEARRDALVRFGGIERVKEWTRDEVRAAAREIRGALTDAQRTLVGGRRASACGAGSSSPR